MARSQEKAMSALNRWVDQRRAVEGGASDMGRAPRFPSECRSIKQGEAARSQMQNQISAAISQIHNATLGEQRIRVLNDEINRLIRSKYAWEMQIRSLGGPDYTRVPSGLGEKEGVEIPGQGGYKYFGAAKDLPGVRDLLEVEIPIDQGRKSRKDLLQFINSAYYGWTDDQHPTLLQDERAAEMASANFIAPDPTAGSSVGGGDWSNDLAFSLDRVLELVTNIGKSELEQILVRKKKESLLAMIAGSSGGHANATMPNNSDAQKQWNGLSDHDQDVELVE